MQKALDAEIDTALDPRNSEKILALCKLYEKLSLEDEALHIAQRGYTKHKIQPDAVLPWIIEHILERRGSRNGKDPVLLNVHTTFALGLKDRSPAVRRSLVRALTRLGRIKPAADEWLALLQVNALEQNDWLDLARFVSDHGDVNGLGKALIESQGASPKGFESSGEPSCASETQVDRGSIEARMFSILCLQVEQDKAACRRILAGLSPEGINDSELSLHLGILAFRLGDYEFAIKAAQHAISMKPEWPVARRALQTFCSFSGTPLQSERNISLGGAALDALRELARQAPLDRYTWGFLEESPGSDAVACARLFSTAESRELDCPESDDVLASFSILPKANPDPVEVLAYLEWDVPHVMLEKKQEGPILRAFVGAGGHREWAWEEVVLDTGCTTAPMPGSMGAGNTLWHSALEELKDQNSEEDFQL